MDSKLIDRPSDLVLERKPAASEWARAAMPPAMPLAMPAQDLRRRPGDRASKPKGSSARLARVTAFGGALLLALFGAYETILVIDAGGITTLEGILAAIFVVNFLWIAFAASSAIAGVVARPPAIPGLEGHGLPTSRTALIMPVYHEDPVRTTAALQAMGESLIDAGIDGEVELVILSDSRSPDAWVQETMAFGRLREALAPALPVWYRRRWRNRARKAGNVEEFVERWGGRYDYMIVLDADSLMSAETLMALARAMDADPNLGILQTVPVIAGGHSFFARLQQFAGRAYGPVVARAIAAWQGEDGNYWGHNAIIRTAAFAAACGLPVLPGRKPFGGEIMSHDFVEAALMRRAGWSVRMAPDLGGSWEESPPSLLDVAIRDRRWAQGNLQHTKVITAAGLAWPNRVHFAIGIMSYLSSLFWLGLIIVGISLTLQAELGRPEYFPNTFQLFPDWPRFDAVRMFWLFVFTMVVLFLPKVIGLIGVLWQRGLRQGCGGALAAIVSVLLETLLSALYAPIMMLLQSRQIYEILRGRDSGWATQRRAGGTSWGDAWRYHRWHMVTGVVLAVGAWLISPVALAWLSPIVIGLILAIPLSRLSGSGTAGRIVSWLRLLRIPEDVEPPMVERRRDELVLRSPPLPEDGLLAVVQSKTLREQHIAALLPRPEEMRGVPDADRLTAAAKVADAETRDEALSWLNPGERVQVLADPTLLQTVADLPHLTSHSA